MERIEYRTVDKSEWRRGAWDSEPDKIQWKDAATGLPCLIVRGPSGALCGYAGVSSSHPLHGQSYDAADEIEVHGGLTYSDGCGHGREDSGICHKPSPGEPDNVWWFGFDCAHYGDLSPRHDREYADGIYRDVAYVTREVARLALQLSGAKATP